MVVDLVATKKMKGSVDNKDPGALLDEGAMGLGMVSHLIAHARSQTRRVNLIKLASGGHYGAIHNGANIGKVPCPVTRFPAT